MRDELKVFIGHQGVNKFVTQTFSSTGCSFDPMEFVVFITVTKNVQKWFFN